MDSDAVWCPAEWWRVSGVIKNLPTVNGSEKIEVIKTSMVKACKAKVHAPKKRYDAWLTALTTAVSVVLAKEKSEKLETIDGFRGAAASI